MFKFSKTKRAFTLIELLIVIALVVIIMALAIPFGVEFLQDQRIEEETVALADKIKTAQNRAITGKHDSSWGIRFNEPTEGKYTLFPLFDSDSFGDPERNTIYDEIFELSPTAEISGADEIIFEKITGKVQFK